MQASGSAKRSEIRTPSAGRIARSARARVRCGVSYRHCSLAVSRSEIAQATALLEHASGREAAISRSRTRALASVWVPEPEAGPAIRRVRQAIRSAHDAGALGDATLRVARARDEAWASSWKRFYKPFAIVPGLWIAPTWARTFKPPNESAMLRLDPGMAFGTGQHPTTQMTLSLMLRRARPSDVVLDVGCGSGILALAAAQRGAHVYASDEDQIAVSAARANFATNALRARLILCAKDVPRAFPQAHVITANLTARVVERLAAVFARKLVRGGWLISSGVVESGKERVLRALRLAGLQCIEVRSQGEWFAFAHEKTQSKEIAASKLATPHEDSQGTRKRPRGNSRRYMGHTRGGGT